MVLANLHQKNGRMRERVCLTFSCFVSVYHGSAVDRYGRIAGVIRSFPLILYLLIYELPE